jgi:alcohol dehydrogenase (NADP+)
MAPAVHLEEYILASIVVISALIVAWYRTKNDFSAAAMGRKSVRLSSGYHMPLIGLGTWQAQPGEVGNAVAAALKAGYRHIDCAAIYGNEKEVGSAIADAITGKVLKRRELFVTSKLWNTEHHPQHVRAACQASLAALGLEYLDLYLIHWPQQFAHVDGQTYGIPRQADGSVRYASVPLADTWRAMEALVDEGLVRSIGVSNFNAAQLEAICAGARIMPACNQVESHPFLAQQPLRDACRSRGVVLSAYSPLGSGASVDGHTVTSHPELERIGRKHRHSAAQVALAFQVRRGVPCLPKSVTAKRILENLDLGRLVRALDEAEVSALAALDKGQRVVYGGPKVERNGELEPRDLIHPDYPWNADGSERGHEAGVSQSKKER